MKKIFCTALLFLLFTQYAYAHNLMTLAGSNSSGIVMLASGTVTLSNTRLSAVNGTAFVDFSTEDVLTDYVPYRGKLTITDSAGKKLVGYIKAAGTGETYGSEMLVNPDMELDDGSYVPFNANHGTVTRSSTYAHAGTYSMFVEAGVTGNTVDQRNVPFVAGCAYKLTTYMLTLTEGAEVILHCRTIISGDSAPTATRVTGTPLTWTYTEYYLTSVNTSVPDYGRFRFIVSPNTEDYYFDTASCKQILTPSTTGVTITSTPNGTTYDWESQESGFNYNDTSGYTYEIWR